MVVAALDLIYPGHCAYGFAEDFCVLETLVLSKLCCAFKQGMCSQQGSTLCSWQGSVSSSPNASVCWCEQPLLPANTYKTCSSKITNVRALWHHRHSFHTRTQLVSFSISLPSPLNLFSSHTPLLAFFNTPHVFTVLPSLFMLLAMLFHVFLKAELTVPHCISLHLMHRNRWSVCPL